MSRTFWIGATALLSASLALAFGAVFLHRTSWRGGGAESREGHTLLSEPLTSHNTCAPPLPTELLPEPIPPYPWESQRNGRISPITKEYFQCRGSPLSPPIAITQDGKVVENIFDCNGPDSHSLPIRRGQEFIYPVLIELLNEIQAATGKAVVITSGHRCPTHNRYVDRSPRNQGSKHQMGAEVSFYVAGAEHSPESIINIITSVYSTHPRYAVGGSDYTQFERYDGERDCATKPWMNKEILVKLYLPHEGRNGDNRHAFPYFSIQVRFDRETNMRVLYSPAEAQCFLRH